jgi:hypothetical protein
MRHQRTVSTFVLSVLMVAPTFLVTGQSPNQTGKPPVVPPRIVHLVKPDCSAGQSCHNLHGLVVLNVDVLTDGTAQETGICAP